MGRVDENVEFEKVYTKGCETRATGRTWELSGKAIVGMASTRVPSTVMAKKVVQYAISFDKSRLQNLRV